MTVTCYSKDKPNLALCRRRVHAKAQRRKGRKGKKEGVVVRQILVEQDES